VIVDSYIAKRDIGLTVVRCPNREQRDRRREVAARANSRRRISASSISLRYEFATAASRFQGVSEASRSSKKTTADTAGSGGALRSIDLEMRCPCRLMAGNASRDCVNNATLSGRDGYRHNRNRQDAAVVERERLPDEHRTAADQRRAMVDLPEPDGPTTRRRGLRR